MRYARIHEGSVVEIGNVPDGFPLDQCFHADLADKMVACPEDVSYGWAYNAETNTFVDPNAPVVEEPVVETPPPEEPASETPQA